ncbi:MAG: hypothetical protein ASARMPREDX12_004926 [Alectoria sarmentosa]|nr:MAG: hypothetical protein ASARMPREDX12_004926 [Alectoria sarmentosa]
MRLVLVPGEVHIRATKPHGVKAKIQQVWDAVQRFPKKDRPGIPTMPSMPSLPGFQMLATCRLLYGQNHEIFYSSNTFFLPPGPFEETLTHFFRNLQAEHVNMISRLGVTFGLEDLTPAVFKQVQDVMSHNTGYLLSDQVARAWGVAVQVHLSDIWQQKLAFLRRTREIKTVKLATVDRVLEIDGSNLGRAFRGIGACVCDYNICAKEVAELVAHAEMRVKKEVADRVERDGWRALRTWVIGGGCQSGL